MSAEHIKFLDELRQAGEVQDTYSAAKQLMQKFKLTPGEAIKIVGKWMEEK